MLLLRLLVSLIAIHSHAKDILECQEINNRTKAKNTLSRGFPPVRPKQHGSWLTVTKELLAHRATAICAGRLNTKVSASL